MLNDLNSSPIPWNFFDTPNPIVFCNILVYKLRGEKVVEQSKLYCDEFSLSLLSDKKYNIMNARQLSWFHVKYIRLVNPSTIELGYKDRTISFRHALARKLTHIILNHILNILHYTEYPVIEVDNFNINKFVYSEKRVTLRYRARCFARGAVPDLDICKRLVYNSFNINEFDTYDFTNDIEVLDDVLFSISVNTNIDKLIVHKMKRHPTSWQPLIRSIYRNPNVRKICTMEKYDETFISFSQAIQKNPKQILSLEFRKNKFHSNVADEIALMLTNSSIRELTLNNCLEDRKFLANFFRAFREKSSFDRLVSLKIIDIYGFSLDSLGSMSNLTELALISLNLDVNGMLIYLRAAGIIQRIKKIDFSKNLLHNKIECHFGGATHIILDGCSCSPLGLSTAIWYTGTSNLPTTLSISHLIITQEDMKSAFEKVPDGNTFNIQELHFDGNQILPGFLVFISKLSALRVLSLRDFNIASDPDLDTLCLMISHASNFEHLDLSRYNKSYDISPEKFKQLLTSISSNRSIKSLSLVGNNFRSTSLTKLAETLLYNRVIKTLTIDKTGLTTTNTWMQFFDSLLIRGVPLVINMPQQDFNEMRKQGLMSEYQYNVIKKNIKLIKLGNKEVSIPENSLKRTKTITSHIHEVNTNILDNSFTLPYSIPDVRVVGTSKICVPDIPEPKISTEEFSLANVLSHLS